MGYMILANSKVSFFWDLSQDMRSSSFLPRNRPLIGRLDRSANQRPDCTHVLTLISEKTDFKIMDWMDLIPKMSSFGFPPTVYKLILNTILIWAKFLMYILQQYSSELMTKNYLHLHNPSKIVQPWPITRVFDLMP